MKDYQRVKILHYIILKNSPSGNPNYLIIYKKYGCDYIEHAYTKNDCDGNYIIGSYSINKWVYCKIEWKNERNYISWLKFVKRPFE